MFFLNKVVVVSVSKSALFCCTKLLFPCRVSKLPSFYRMVSLTKTCEICMNLFEDAKIQKCTFMLDSMTELRFKNKEASAGH